MSISKALLQELYEQQRLSMAEIAVRLRCSPNKVVYWMAKYGIQRREISEAIYQWHNPSGNPFGVRTPQTPDEVELFHLGVGLYIGEGSKKRHSEVSIANSDPRVICTFIRFLCDICGVDRDSLFAILHVYDDVDLDRVQLFWESATGLPRAQFHKPTVKVARGGTYAEKSKYGTMTVGVYSTKLHQIILTWCDEHLD